MASLSIPRYCRAHFICINIEDFYDSRNSKLFAIVCSLYNLHSGPELDHLVPPGSAAKRSCS